ncbi:hypothetical protein [Streptosporangium sp. NPDC004631]
MNSPSGDIVVERAHGALTAKTASGAIRAGEVFLHTYAGNREVGIRESTAGRLDVNAMAGNVRDEPGTADDPGEGRADRQGTRTPTPVTCAPGLRPATPTNPQDNENRDEEP